MKPHRKQLWLAANILMSCARSRCMQGMGIFVSGIWIKGDRLLGYRASLYISFLDPQLEALHICRCQLSLARGALLCDASHLRYA